MKPERRETLLLFCCLLLTLLTARTCAEKHYCPYFKNRAPSPQVNLENCTWYKDNSCCLNHEIKSIFSTVPTTLMAANEACRKYTNYLMCYVCAPNQETFYHDETLTVCNEFCNRWHGACRDALWKEFTVASLYNNGSEFCRARKFVVAAKDDKRTGCFTFASSENSGGSVSAVSAMIWSFGLVVLTLPCKMWN